MAVKFMHLNGWAVPIVTCEPVHVPIADARGYGPNGVYQFARNEYARAWTCRTGLLTGAQRDALLDILGHRGDGWSWPLSAAPSGVEYLNATTDSPGFSSKFRAQSAQLATIVSAYGGDGSRVYDHNGNPMAPFAGAAGSVVLDHGTTNLLAAVHAQATASGNFTALGGGVLSTDTSRYWRGGASVKCVATNAGDGLQPNAAVGGLANATRYSVTVHVKRLSGDAELRLLETGGSNPGSTIAAIPWASDNDAWIRATAARVTGATAGTLTWQVVQKNATAATFWANGAQLENTATHFEPTAWIDSGADPWLAGNGVRGGGLLDYSNFITTYTRGCTIACWYNVQRVTSASLRQLVRTAGVDPRFDIYINTAGQVVSEAVASDGSFIRSNTAGAITLGWHHFVAVYDRDASSLTLYVDGVSQGTDSYWGGGRQYWDAENTSDVVTIGTQGLVGAQAALGIIGAIQLLPYPVPASVADAWYDYDDVLLTFRDDRAQPAVMPIGAYGSFLHGGDRYADVYAQVDSAPHEPWFNGSTWETRGGRVAFTLFEDAKR